MKLNPRQFARAYLESCEGQTVKQIEHITALFLKKLRIARGWKQIPAIIAHIQRYADEREGVTPLTIVTARGLGEAANKKIADSLGFKKARITEQVQPELVGGFIARTVDTIFDGSLKTQLQHIKKHLES